MQKHLVVSKNILLPDWVRKQSIGTCSSKLVVIKLLSMKSYLEQLTNLIRESEGQFA